MPVRVTEAIMRRRNKKKAGKDIGQTIGLPKNICWSPRGFMHNSLWGLQRIVQNWSSEWQFCGQKCCVDEKGQKRTARLIQLRGSNSNNLVLQQWCAEKHLWTHTSLKWIGYSSRRPISLKNMSNKYLLKWSPSVHTVHLEGVHLFHILLCCDLLPKYCFPSSIYTQIS